MATTRRKEEDRPLWIPILSTASVAAILASSYFLLKIYAPSLAELPLSGNLEKAVVGAGVLGIVFGLIKALLKIEALAPVRAALAKVVSLIFERPRVALSLAPMAMALALGTWWHWQASAQTPILRIVPDGAFADYLDDGAGADKPPESTFEIRVEVRDEAEVERFHPRDERPIDIGASESVLRWRASREDTESAPKKRSYLGTARLRPGAELTIRVLCRKTGLELFHTQARIPGKSVPLAPEDDDEFGERMKSCVPIEPV